MTTGDRARVLNWVFPVLLLAINVYICREAFFTEPTGHWNSMHGQWMELARLGGWRLLGVTWWPYCFLGAPIEFVYAPLVPLLTASLSHLTGGSIPLAFHILTGTVYCLGPVTLYVVSWRWARAPLCGFAAALIYSLVAPTAWILPDGQFQWAAGLAPYRMNLVFDWDDLPHLLSLTLTPLAAWLLSRALESRRLRDWVWPALVMGVMMLDSMFGVTESLLVLLTAPAALRPLRVVAFVRAAAIGASAYLLICPWAPPSLLRVVRYNSIHDGEADTIPHSFEALGMVVLATLITWLATKRHPRAPVRWLILFACPVIMIPVLSGFNGLRFFPQPGRYKLEMELAIAWLIPFGLAPWMKRLPRYWSAALLVPLALGAAWQIASFRQSAIALTKPVDVRASIEYRVARWLAANLPGQRVLLGGSIERGLNLYADLPQLSGPYTTDPNPMIGIAWYTIKIGQNAGPRDADYSITWMKAMGVQAIGVPGRHSPDFWKPYLNPGKFEGMLPVLWRENDTTIYRVPQAGTSLAHTIRPDQLIHRTPANGLDTPALEPYVSAINDPTAPQTTFEWLSSGHARIRSHIPAGDVISTQIDYDPGWSAHVNSFDRPLHRDGIGMMTIEPQCTGDCEITLDFDGGVEARVTRVLSWAMLLGLCACMFARAPAAHSRNANPSASI